MNELTPGVTGSDNQLTRPNFKITLVEYGDYQCPYCAKAHPLIKRFLEEKGDEVRFVFRNFPLQTIHDQALNAARSAEAAARQNRFWPMHNLLFNNQDRFAEGVFQQFAEELGLDPSRFDRDYNDKGVIMKIEADFKSGLQSGVNGTPSFFLEGNKIQLKELSYESLLNAVGQHLDSVSK